MENPSEITNNETNIANDLEEVVENVGGMIDLNTSADSIEALDEIVGTLDSNMAQEMAHVEETHATVEVSSEVPAEVDDFLQKRRSTIVTKQLSGDDSPSLEPQAEITVEKVTLLAESQAEIAVEELALPTESPTEIAVEELALPAESPTEIAVEELALPAESQAEIAVEEVALPTESPTEIATEALSDSTIQAEPMNQTGNTMEQNGSNNIGIEALNGLVSDLDTQANQIYSTLDQISKQMVTIGENMQNMGKRIENIGKEVSTK